MFWVIAIAMAVIAMVFVLLPIMKAKLTNKTLVIIGFLVAIPLSGLIGYEIGLSESPPAQTTPVAKDALAASISSAPDPLMMVAQLEARLKGGSGTPDEWAMLARSYVTLNRHKDAVSAYAKATETITNDAQMYADYADALAMSKGGLDQDSEALIDKALKLDSFNPKALALKATVAFNKKDYQSAIDLWEKLLTAPGLSQDWANSTRSNIKEARDLMRLDSNSRPLADTAEKAAIGSK